MRTQVEKENAAFYHPVEILPTRGRSILVAVKAAVLFAHRTVGRKLGLWRIIKAGATFFQNWQECPVIGPDRKPLFVDLRGQGFGMITQGFGVSEITPIIAQLDEAAVVLDIGANIGVWSRLFSVKVPKGKVYAFEPSASTFRLLLKNSSELRNIECIQIALGGKTGFTGFNEDTEPCLRHLANNVEGGTVRISTLDDWVKENVITRIDLIKLDIEGFEEELLSGAGNTIKALRPAILFEFLPWMTAARSQFKGRMIFGFMRRNGYQVYRLDKSGMMHEDFVKPEDWTNDYLSLDPTSRFANSVKHLIAVN